MAHRFFRLRRSSWILTTLLLAAPAAALDGIRVGAQELEPVEPWTSDVDLRDLPAPPDWLPGGARSWSRNETTSSPVALS